MKNLVHKPKLGPFRSVTVTLISNGKVKFTVGLFNNS